MGADAEGDQHVEVEDRHEDGEAAPVDVPAAVATSAAISPAPSPPSSPAAASSETAETAETESDTDTSTDTDTDAMLERVLRRESEAVLPGNMRATRTMRYDTAHSVFQSLRL